MKKFLKEGMERLETKFDLMHIIKQHSKHLQFLKEQNEEIFEDDSLNLDSLSEDDVPVNIDDPARIIKSILYPVEADEGNEMVDYDQITKT